MIFITVILALIAIAGFVVGSIMSKTDPGYRDAAQQKRIAKRIKLGVPAIAAVILFLAVLFSGIRIIDQTEVGVVKTYGRITGSLDGGGMSFVNPFTDAVSMYDTKVRAKELTFASYTKDAQAIDVLVEIQYELPKEKAIIVSEQYGNYDALESKLGNVTEERIKVVLSSLTAMTLTETRASLSTNASIEVRKLEETFPIKFTSVIVKDISFSDAFEAAVEAKMTAEQVALKAEQEKKVSITNAQRDKEVSITAAQGRKEQAELDKQTAITKAQAEAEALRIKKEALSAMPPAYLEQLYLERWDGKLPQIYGGDTNLMVTPDFNK